MSIAERARVTLSVCACACYTRADTRSLHTVTRVGPWLHAHAHTHMQHAPSISDGALEDDAGIALDKHPMMQELCERWNRARDSDDDRILNDKRLVAKMVYANLEAHIAPQSLLPVSAAFASLVQRMFKVPMCSARAAVARDALAQAVGLPLDVVDPCVHQVGRDLFDSFATDDDMCLPSNADVDALIDDMA